MQSDKLKNFPKVYYISLEGSEDRRKHLEEQFSKYSIYPIGVISKKWDESEDTLEGTLIHTLDKGTKGSLVSHIKMIHRWYEETNDEWGFFCEDDLSLETVKYWNFTWDEFAKTIPEDAMGLQMLTIRQDFDTFDIRKRRWDDWAATAYILKRKYVEILLKKYYVSKKHFKVEIYNDRLSSHIQPLVENAIFDCIELDNGVCFYVQDSMYTIPLLVEDVWKFDTTFIKCPENEKKYKSLWKKVETHQKEQHYESAEIVLNYWKNKGLSYV